MQPQTWPSSTAACAANSAQVQRPGPSHALPPEARMRGCQAPRSPGGAAQVTNHVPIPHAALSIKRGRPPAQSAPSQPAPRKRYSGPGPSDCEATSGAHASSVKATRSAPSATETLLRPKSMHAPPDAAPVRSSPAASSLRPQGKPSHSVPGSPRFQDRVSNSAQCWKSLHSVHAGRSMRRRCAHPRRPGPCDWRGSPATACPTRLRQESG